MVNIQVSVYVVTFNRCEKLSRCLDSILMQDFKSNYEVVVDNGSNDGTKSVLEKYSSFFENFKYILLGENLGACVARNIAIGAAKGKYVTGSDDDEWLPSRLTKMSEAYDDSYSLVFADDIFEGDGWEKPSRKLSVISLESMKYQNEVGNQDFSRRDRFIEVGLFDESLVAAQDYDMWFRMIKKYGAAKNTLRELLVFLGGNVSDISGINFDPVNQGFETKSKALQRLIMRYNYIKKIYKMIIPEKVRDIMRKGVVRDVEMWNRRKSVVDYSINAKKIENIYGDIIAQDIKKLSILRPEFTAKWI